jgi:Tfp pilus assembly protein PilF
MGAAEPQDAHFNRAIAYEALGDLRAAYEDYKAALAIKPDWALPQRELARFTVTTR